MGFEINPGRVDSCRPTCPGRTPVCHIDCPDYRAAKEKAQELNARVRAEKKLHADIEDIAAKNKERFAGKWKRK